MRFHSLTKGMLEVIIADVNKNVSQEKITGKKKSSLKPKTAMKTKKKLLHLLLSLVVMAHASLSAGNLEGEHFSFHCSLLDLGAIL